ncbi:MAG: ABC transporter ATP-binding protein [Saccharofermentans sp.]|nr:ABC transporter ATP-binding protein [Saccharofermentans sp.]
MPIVSLRGINKSFKNKEIFKNFSLDVEAGEFLSITGASGKGKTTLLNIIGLLEKADSGDVYLFDTQNANFGSKKARDIRRHRLSYLFQNYGLVDNETCRFNLDLVLEFSDLKKDQKQKAISEVLKKVGLEGFENRKVFSLSGGEQQRVALAQIILKSPDLILADEPTGSLDVDNRDYVLSVLKELNESGKTIIMVTHDAEVDSCAKRHICL